MTLSPRHNPIAKPDIMPVLILIKRLMSCWQVCMPVMVRCIVAPVDRQLYFRFNNLLIYLGYRPTKQEQTEERSKDINPLLRFEEVGILLLLNV